MSDDLSSAGSGCQAVADADGLDWQAFRLKAREIELAAGVVDVDAYQGALLVEVEDDPGQDLT